MSTRVFVGGLTHRVRERDLEKFFRKYGRIKEVLIKNGYGFIVSILFDLSSFIVILKIFKIFLPIPCFDRKKMIKNLFCNIFPFMNEIIFQVSFTFCFAIIDTNSGIEVIEIFLISHIYKNFCIFKKRMRLVAP